MLRTLIACATAVVMVFTSMAALAATEGPETQAHITLSGRLEWVDNLSGPHYEVSGFVLLYEDRAHLDSLRGRQVRVEGTESTTPSIYMRKAIHVTRIEEAAPPLPEPDPKDPGLITLPVILDPALSLPRPDPVPPQDGEAALPQPPASPVSAGAGETRPLPAIPWNGTPLYILFGTVERQDGSYYVTDATPEGLFRTALQGDAAALQELEALIGQRVAIVVTLEQLPDGAVRHVFHRALPLLVDLANRVESGPDRLYVRPVHPITVTLEGEPLPLRQAPIIGNSRILLPLRAVAEALGAEVGWDQTTRTATVSMGDREVAVRIGSNRVVVSSGGQVEAVIANDVAPVIVQSRTLVPVRVIAEGLGLTVDWDPASRTVTLR